MSGGRGALKAWMHARKRNRGEIPLLGTIGAVVGRLRERSCPRPKAGRCAPGCSAVAGVSDWPVGPTRGWPRTRAGVSVRSLAAMRHNRESPWAHVGELVGPARGTGILPVAIGPDTGWKPVPHQMPHISPALT